MEKARLDKIIAGEGTYSRREVRLLVRQGRVLVNGVPARSPEDKVVPEAVEIMVDGTVLHCRRYTWIMLHKPAGVLSATEDGRGGHGAGLAAAGAPAAGTVSSGAAGQGYGGIAAADQRRRTGPRHPLSQASCGQGLLCPHCRLSDGGGLQGVCGRHDPGRRPGMPARRGWRSSPPGRRAARGWSPCGRGSSIR